MFKSFKTQVQHSFTSMTKGVDTLFTLDVEKDEIYQIYLQAIPEQYRQTHTCNACRSYINNYGHVVAIKNNTIVTMWDFETNETPYENVPTAIREFLKTKTVNGVFVTNDSKLGLDKNRQRMEDGHVHVWEHFYFDLPKQFVYRGGHTIDSYRGSISTTVAVFERSLDTLTPEAISTVLELIVSNNLYRGTEFKKSIVEFQKLQNEYLKLTDPVQKSVFAWANYKASCSRIRNTAIGTLLIDLSEGVDLERAVRSFENVVAPTNYKRPTALVTPAMVEKAKQSLVSLGLDTAIVRRSATEVDIPVENLLYVHRSTNAPLDVFAQISKDTPVSDKELSKAKKISLDDFVKNVIPTSTGIEVLVKSNSNFVTLFAPSDAESKPLFKWNNGLSWTYANNMTDVIKEKVKKAGGKVDGKLRVSLEWFNTDDLDLHVFEPNSNEIYFANKRSCYSDGLLDVDMNVCDPVTNPVENVIFADRPKTGKYKVVIENYRRRMYDNVGFNLQIATPNQEFTFSYEKAVMAKVSAVTFEYDDINGITDIKTTLTSDSRSGEVNGLKTNVFSPVKMMMYSPNYWDTEEGNKHLFFIVDGVKIDTPLRTFFNEYLRNDLQEHRKVFELLGGKLEVTPGADQMSGLGYSLTQRNSVFVRSNNKELFEIQL